MSGIALGARAIAVKTKQNKILSLVCVCVCVCVWNSYAIVQTVISAMKQNKVG